MNKSNLYFEHTSKWSPEQWLDYCPMMEYRVKEPAEFPPFLPKSLTDKFNCAMAATSGNQTYQTFLFQGYRVDGDELDEHQYIFTVNIENGQSFAGFIEHADYEGRTTEIPLEMKRCLALSGVGAEFRFERKPPNNSGSLEELAAGGLISGFQNSLEIQQKKIGLP